MASKSMSTSSPESRAGRPPLAVSSSTTTGDRKIPLTDVLKLACKTVGADFGQIYLAEQSPRSLSLIASFSPGAVHIDVPQEAEDLVWKVVDSGTPLRMTSGELGPGWASTTVRVALFLPLVWQERIFGGFAFFWSDRGSLSAEGTLHLGAVLGAQVALSLENADLREALAKSGKDLRTQVQEIQKTLRRAQSETRAASEQMLVFGHQLRTPLTTLELYLDLLCSHPERSRDYSDVLGREVKRMQEMVEEMLILGQVNVDRPDLQMSLVEVPALAQILAESAALLASKRGITLQVTSAEQCPLVLADAKLLEQGLSNVLNNALLYTPRGGRVTLTVEPREREGEAWVVLEVRDSGAGISTEDLPHVFEAFYRGQAGRLSKTPGTGLGLAIARRVVESHRGLIEVQSTAGMGTSFWIWLRAEGIPLPLFRLAEQRPAAKPSQEQEES
jgi:signal transduction histidine kinase